LNLLVFRVHSMHLICECFSKLAAFFCIFLGSIAGCVSPTLTSSPIPVAKPGEDVAGL
jgi:hypothetical protein